MTRLDMVRAAVAELGDQATAAQVAGFVAERFGQDVGVGFVPIYRATLRAEEHLRAALSGPPPWWPRTGRPGRRPPAPGGGDPPPARPLHPVGA